MAKRKHARKAARRQEAQKRAAEAEAEDQLVDEPEAEADDAAPNAPFAEDPPAKPPRYLRWVDLGIAVVGLLAALLAVPDDRADFPGIWTVGRVIGAGAAAVWIAALLGPSSPRLRWFRVVGAGLAVLALMALFARNPALHQSPFAGGNEGLLGLPSPLAWLLIAAVPSRLTDGDRVRTWVFVVGLVWATVALLAPSMWFHDAQAPLAVAIEHLGHPDPGRVVGGLTVLLLVPSLIAGWAALLTPQPHRVTRWIVRSGVPVLVAGVALCGVVNGIAPHGLLLAALLGMVGHVVAPVAQTVAGAAPPVLVRKLVVALPAVIILLVFFLLKLHGIGPSNTDENIYFYMAADLANGNLPYSDYFFAHPPLHVVLPGVFFTIFGYSLTFAKLFSVTAAMVTGVAVYAIGRRHFGLAVAVIAMVGFLFASETLKASTNMTGINLTTMWLALGLWQQLKGRGLTAGVLYGLAATTGFYAMAGICAALALAWFRPGAPGATGWGRVAFPLRTTGAFLLVAGGINLVFYASAPESFIDGVYTYHGLKALRNPLMVDLTSGPLALLHNIGAMVGGKEFTKELFYDGALWAGLLLAPLAAVAAFFLDRTNWKKPPRLLSPWRLYKDGRHGIAAWIWLVALALFVQYAMFREIYSFYWVLIYPVLALLVGYAAVESVRLIAALTRPSSLGRGLPHAAVGLLILALFATIRAGNAREQTVFSGEIEKAGARNAYVWTEATALPGLAGIAHDAFWGRHRLRGHHEPGFRHYLWTKKRHISVLDDMAAHLKARMAPDETIIGASTLTPLIALASDRRIAASEVDTNNKRFKARRDDGTPLLSERDFWTRVCHDNVRYIVSASRSYFSSATMRRLVTIRQWFERERVFEDHRLSYGRAFPITLYRRIDAMPRGAESGAVCRWED